MGLYVGYIGVIRPLTKGFLLSKNKPCTGSIEHGVYTAGVGTGNSWWFTKWLQVGCLAGD